MPIAVAGLLLGGFIAAALAHLNALPAWSSDVPVRDVTTGCAGFAKHYTDIRQAFGMSEPGPACKPPARWSETAVARAVDAASARLAVDEALRAAHRQFHEMLFWFFRATWSLPLPRGKRSDGEIGDFRSCARRSFAIIDWLSLSATAAAFAICGHFEPVLHGCRTLIGQKPGDRCGLLPAGGSGA
ncbi:hypothetical protein [Accumulibacter sp.]|uniref:hypothetical protein n=1 Tax=Accumulibacter sp. TaxID=2053492 RepID=UPI002CDFC8BD|nr:hypothetical protein [Accumulibacter sp.]HRE70358.1 hypothetical protein [Accumulibacter sp.]